MFDQIEGFWWFCVALSIVAAGVAGYALGQQDTRVKYESLLNNHVKPTLERFNITNFRWQRVDDGWRTQYNLPDNPEILVIERTS